MVSEHLVMGNHMLRSLVVFGSGKGVDKMYMAVLNPFSLNEKHLSVVWHGRRLKVSIFCYLFFFRG